MKLPTQVFVLLKMWTELTLFNSNFKGLGMSEILKLLHISLA